MNKKIIFFILAALCLVNIFLSSYILYQKNVNDTVETVAECFLGDGGCYTVQTSTYAKTFGIANPYYGIVAFSIGVIIFILLALRKIPARYEKDFSDLVLFFLVLGGLFSIWLLYVQFSILKTTCIYCLWVDGIMIAMLILFIVQKLLKD